MMPTVNRKRAPQNRVSWSGLARLVIVLVAFGHSASMLLAQESISREQIRKQLGMQHSLRCTIRSGFPLQYFDFRMYTPYRIHILSRAVQGSKALQVNIWSVPLKDETGKTFTPPKEPHLMTTRFSAEDFQIASNLFIQIDGSIITGAGAYRHFMAIDDGRGGGCIREWTVKVKPPKDQLDELVIAPAVIENPRQVIFQRQRPIKKREDGLRVVVLLNADSRSWTRAISDTQNSVALTSVLRRIAEDERVNEVSVTTFSLEDQKVLDDQDFGPEVDFIRLSRAFRELTPGLADISQLSIGSEAIFLSEMLREREERFARADLLIFAGARSPVTDKAPPTALESLHPLRRGNVQYLVTNPYRWRGPSDRDVIGHAVKTLGGNERDIRLPEDVSKAVDSALQAALKQTRAHAQHE